MARHQEDPVDDIILPVARNLKPEDFDFSVVVAGIPYDVYHFTYLGKPGQLAWAKIDGKCHIAMFREGRYSEKEVQAYLEAHPK